MLIVFLIFQGCMNKKIYSKIKLSGDQTLITSIKERRAMEIVSHSENIQDMINSRDKDGDTPLILATKLKYDTRLLKILIKLGANLDDKNNFGWSALSYAAGNKLRNRIEILVEAGADVNIKNGENKTPLMLLCDDSIIHNKLFETAMYLINSGANLEDEDDYGNTALIYAARLGDVDLFNMLLDIGASINHTNIEGENIMLAAADKGNLEILELTLDIGIDINSVDKDGETAIMKAASNGQIKAISMLLDRGADCYLTSKYGWKVDTFVAFNNDFEILDLLNSRGVKRDNWSELIDACLRRDLNRVNDLLDNGADVNFVSEVGITPLIVAVWSEKIEIVKLLISKGADINARSADKRTVLIHACEIEDIDIIKLLLDSGANTDEKDLDGLKAIDIVIDSMGQEVANEIFGRKKRKKDD